MSAPNFLPNTRLLSEKLYQFVLRRPKLYHLVEKFADWHHDKMGYRKYGLLYDDLINEEPEVVKEALNRLPVQLVFDRNFRQRRAIQLNLNHELLPENEWVTKEEDKHYLFPVILEVCKERDEKDFFDKIQPDLLTRSSSGLFMDPLLKRGDTNTIPNQNKSQNQNQNPSPLK